jgi:ribosomal protein S12 methylthiotransferase accessory factor
MSRTERGWRQWAGPDEGAKSWLAGTHRTRPPARTVEAVRRLMPTLGITRVGNLTGLDRIGVPVVMSCRPLSRSVAVSLGKGLDQDAATASALMEATETWHAERITLPVRYASAAELLGTHRLADIEHLPHRRERPWRPATRHLWIEAIELFSGEPRWLPYELVHTDYTLPGPAGSGLFVASTNGLASGMHRLEACCHALCEVIERDASARWWGLARTERAATRVDLGSIDDPACRETIKRFTRAGFEVAVWSTTSDVGIASFLAVLRDRQVEASHPGFGSGTHPSAPIALLRALLEAAQVRLTYIAGARDDLPRDQYGRAAMARRLAALATLLADPPLVPLPAVPTALHPSFAAELDHVLDRLAAAGLNEALLVDLTRDDIGLAVVRVIVPGLRPDDENAEILPGARRSAGAAA